MSERPRRGEPITVVRLNDGRVRYRVRMDAGTLPSGKRRQVCSTWDTLAQARAEVARIRNEQGAGTYVAKSTETVDTWLESWLSGKHALKETTRENYQYALKPFIEDFGAMRLQALTKRQIDGFVQGRLTAVSARSVELFLKVLTQALNSAVDQQLLRINPAAAVDRPRGDSPPVGQAWTPEDAGRFLAFVANGRLNYAWHLSLHGLRRGEVVGLRWDDVDFQGEQITIRQTRVVANSRVVVTSPKNREQRYVPLGRATIDALRTEKALQAAERLRAGAAYLDEGWVVVDALGRPMRPETYSGRFRQLASEAGLPVIRLHDLRHTTASILASNGVALTTAAGLLGHDPVVFARTYAHLYDKDKRDAVRGLDQRLSGNRQARDQEL